MERSNINRRSFIKTAGIGAVGIQVLPGFLSRVAPSDKIRVAHIGNGNMGKNHINWFAAFPDVEIAALCDVDELRVAEARKLVVSVNPNAKPDLYSDYRKIIDRKDIDVITCATPDHWHALVAVNAF